MKCLSKHREKYCEKCKKIILPNEETYLGLCFDCYKEHLYEMIEEMGKKRPEPEKKDSIFDKIKNFLKS